MKKADTVLPRVSRVRPALVTARIRAILSEGPATIPEMAVEIDDEPLRRLRTGIWALTATGQAVKIGRIPKETRGRGNNIYALTRKGEARQLELAEGTAVRRQQTQRLRMVNNS